MNLSMSRGSDLSRVQTGHATLTPHVSSVLPLSFPQWSPRVHGVGRGSGLIPQINRFDRLGCGPGVPWL